MAQSAENGVASNHWGINPERCPLTTAMTVIGGKWKAHIWWRVSRGLTRPGELRRAMTPITAKTLTQQLREMERDGILERRMFAEMPPRVEYTLTDYGRTLEPVFFAISGWGATHLQRRERMAQKVKATP